VCFIEAQGSSRYTLELVSYVKLNGIAVWNFTWPAEIENWRGVTLFIVDLADCTLQEVKNFDTWLNVENAERLRDYLQGLVNGTVLVGVTYAEPMRAMLPPHPNAALSELSKLGADVSDLNTDGAFAFAARIGDPARTVFKKGQYDMPRMPRIFATFNAIFSGAQYTIYHRSSSAERSSLHCVP